MLPYSVSPIHVVKTASGSMPSFLDPNQMKNIDLKTVSSFGEEWKKFDFFNDTELEKIGNTYFDLLEHTSINKESVALDVGCGTGRWSRYLSSRVKFIEGVDPSEAAFVAQEYLKDKQNVRISMAEVSHIPFADNSFDLVFSLGVLHHIPDTAQALKDCVSKVKPGGYFLVYLYYDFNDRGVFFQIIFKLSSILRWGVSKMPFFIKSILCDALAVILYLPFVAVSKFIRWAFPTQNWHEKIPLSYYTDKSFTIIRNDSLDRFGTPLEQRFSKEQILKMMQEAGLKEIQFSELKPFWHAIGKK